MNSIAPFFSRMNYATFRQACLRGSPHSLGFVRQAFREQRRLDYCHNDTRFEYGIHHGTVVNVALPALQSPLGATISEIQCVGKRTHYFWRRCCLRVER